MSWRSLPWSGIAVLLLGVAIVCSTAALSVRGACTNAEPPVRLPESGTPRAAWCAAEHGASPGVLLAVLPVLACAVGCVLARRRAGWCWATGGVVCVLALGNAFVVGQLEHALTT